MVRHGMETSFLSHTLCIWDRCIRLIHRVGNKIDNIFVDRLNKLFNRQLRYLWFAQVKKHDVDIRVSVFDNRILTMQVLTSCRNVST